MRDHVRRCTWERDDEGNWDTGCGERFCLNDGTPSENSMRFCCYCGGKLEAKECWCQWEAGDSPCPTHGMDEEKGGRDA